MVCANLHIICGNCGSKDVYYRFTPIENRDYKDEVNVSLICPNCSTIHFPEEFNDKNKSDSFMSSEERKSWREHRNKEKAWQER